MAGFYAWLGPKKSSRLRLAVMDMWKPFRVATAAHAPQAAILFDKFHVMRHLGEALDQVRKSEYRRLSGRDRRYIKGQKYTLLSRKENLTLDGKRALKRLLSVNGSTRPMFSRRALVSCGAMNGKVGRGVSSRTGGPVSSGSVSNRTRSSPR
jgi:transposase